ncbi:MAG: primase C-terminal domain-containing protein, partial [Acidithiobacillus sp.]|nr:primase C-terminal domain-containing protein [Acidithiobacillus sp.]
LNSQFSTPLPFSEVKSISKSIAKWVWRHMTPAGLQALIQRTHSPEWQRARGKKASNQALAGKAAKNQREAGRMARNQRAIAASGGRASGLSRRRAREETMALAIRFCKNMKTMGASVRAISEALETIHGIRVSHATVWRWIR